jgi:hypothetical protein
MPDRNICKRCGKTIYDTLVFRKHRKECYAEGKLNRNAR